MPDKMNDGAFTSKDSPNSKDSKKIKKMKAKMTKLKAKMVDDKAGGGEKEKSVYDKKASEDKIGKCPICDSFHYYES